MKTFYVFGLVLLVFACDPVNSDDEILPSQQSDTGGDDEDPIIQGEVIFPNDSSRSNTLVSLLDSKAEQVLYFTLTDLNGKFQFKLPRKEKFVMRVACPDGNFRETEPFGLETLPAILKV